MPTRRKRPKLILCAALTADGKLDFSVPAVPSALYGGDKDPTRHPWAALYDGASGVLVDSETADALQMPEAAARPMLLVRWGELAGWHTAELRAGLLGVLRRFGKDDAGPVLCFGGTRLFRALLDARLVDELHLIVRPVIDGRLGSAALSGACGAFFPASVACRLMRMEPSGDECLLHYRVLRGNRLRAREV